MNSQQAKEILLLYRPGISESEEPGLAAAFTLAEVLAALLFMAIVIPAAIEGLHIASLAGTVAARKGEAARVAQCVGHPRADEEGRCRRARARPGLARTAAVAFGTAQRPDRARYRTLGAGALLDPLLQRRLHAQPRRRAAEAPTRGAARGPRAPRLRQRPGLRPDAARARDGCRSGAQGHQCRWHLHLGSEEELRREIARGDHLPGRGVHTRWRSPNACWNLPRHSAYHGPQGWRFIDVYVLATRNPVLLLR